MKIDLKKFFRKKIKTDSLEKALDQGLITQEELLRLKEQRASEELKNYLSKTKK